MEESIRQALIAEGYVFEYDRRRGEDRVEVWTSRDKQMAVRIEWLRIDEEGWRR